MDYYLGGYYLVLPKPFTFGSRLGQLAVTASECINDHPLGYWAYPWDKIAREDLAEAETTFGLAESKVDSIREWVRAKLDENLVGWAGVFFDIQTASEYR